MQSFKNILQILGSSTKQYWFSGVLIGISAMIRLFEPKILQVTVDGVLNWFVTKEGNSSAGDPVAGDLVAEADSAAQLIYYLLPDLNTHSLSYLLLCLGGIYMVVAMLRALTKFAGGVMTTDATEKSIKRFRDRLFSHIQALPLKYHDNNTTGELIQRSTGDVDTIRNFFAGQLVEIIRMLIIVIFGVYFMAIVHWQYALLSLCVTPFIFLFTYFFFKKEKKIWQLHEDESDKLTTRVSENLSGIRVVQAFAQEEKEKALFDKQNEDKRDIGIRHGILHARFWPFSDLLVYIQITISMIAGGYLALQGAITLGELISFYTYVSILTWPLQRLGRLVSQMGMAIVAIDRIYEILNVETEDYEGSVDKEIKGEIVFDNVSFQYGEDASILKNLSFTIKQGEKLAIIGPAGAGKSTIIKLLSRLYEPTEGQIFLDGEPLSNYSKTKLRGALGIVLQNSFLFSRNIADNIAYTQKTTVQEDVEAVAEKADIHHMMSVFSEGYETMVGEKGVTLSGGQKQRVALARTLLDNPAIFILDDATSAVDTFTEHRIQENLEEVFQDKTAIIIAHRITSIQIADRILVMNEGKMIDIGTAKELGERNEFYQQMLELQVSVEKEILDEI